MEKELIPQNTHQCLVYDVGNQGYHQTLEFQLDLHSRCKAGDIPNAVILVEHNPVITLGAKADPQNLLLPMDLLKKAGIEVVQTDRGGDVTYHGPGQIVGYPIVNLRNTGNDVHNYLRLIEEVVIKTLADYGLSGIRNGLAGVWVGERKVCSIGIAVRRWVTYHGFALNVNPTLEHFNFINPCGLKSEQISSMEKLLHQAVDISEVKTRILTHFTELFGFDLIHTNL